jgi:DNA-binding CsgD family transcriptional regulator
VKRPTKAALTARETQVARLVLASKTTAEIATILGMAEGTVGAHLSQVYAFYEVDNRAGFIARVYSTPELRRSLITESIAMTDTVTPQALSPKLSAQIVAERNVPDLTLRLGESAPYSYPLCLELLNSAVDRSVPSIVREGPLIWTAYLQGDMRFVSDHIVEVTKPLTVTAPDSHAGETVQQLGLNVAAMRMTAWLLALRAAALALYGSERQQSEALAAADAAVADVASSQLLPWTMRITRVFVYACSTRSVTGLERLLQLNTEIDSLNPVRIYLLSLAVRLAQHLGPNQRLLQKVSMDLFLEEANAVREEIQRRASATVFNVRAKALGDTFGVGWEKTEDGRYAHQCLKDDAELDNYLKLEAGILREKLDYAKVVADYPDYREKLKIAHAKLRAQRKAAAGN